MSGFGKSQDEGHLPQQTGDSGTSLLLSASPRPNIGKGDGVNFRQEREQPGSGRGGIGYGDVSPQFSS